MAHKTRRQTEPARGSKIQTRPAQWDKSSRFSPAAKVDAEELAEVIRSKVSLYVEGMKSNLKLSQVGNLDGTWQDLHVPELTDALHRLVQAERDRGMLLRTVLKELQEVTQGLRVANAARVLKQTATVTGLEMRRPHRRSLRE
mmetsp:Transcript_54241/g.100255  ORF Transcript_54241/g.100255 Transcript_54241/m.100255 type:complete len:143 (-) Transcript_54241:4-432(-)